MKFSTKVVAWFVAGVVLLLAVAGASAWMRSQYAEETLARKRSGLILSELTRLVANVEECQGEERGYVITGSVTYRMAYEQAERATKASMRRLHELVGTESRKEQELVNRLDQPVKEQLELMNHALQVRRDEGLEAGLRAVLFERLNKSIVKIREIVGEFQDHEAAKMAGLSKRIKALEQARTMMDASLVALAIVLAVLGARQINREVGYRERAEHDLEVAASELQQSHAALAESHGVLENRVEERTRDLQRANTQQQVYETFFTESAWGAAIVDARHGLIQFANPAVARMHGYGSDELIGKSTSDLFEDPGVLREAAHLAEKKGRLVKEAIHIRKDGSRFPCMTDVSVVRDPQGLPLFRLVYFQDVTRQHEAEEALEKEEDLYRSTFERAPVGIAHVGLNERWLRVNDTFCEIVGYRREELLRLSYKDITLPEDLGESLHLMRDLYDGKVSSFTIEKRYRRKDGTIVWGDVMVSMKRDDSGAPSHFIAVMKDTTDRKRMEDRLQASLKEKELILHETSHRLKNNLNVICSLVGLQAAGCEDPALRKILDDVRDRVRAVALVHDQLSLSRDTTHVEFAALIRRLLTDLWRAYGVDPGQVRRDLDLQPIDLSVEYAEPCGWILNELATNALKHAFRGGVSGTFSVRLTARPDGFIVLCVRDDGVGLPEGMEWRRSPSTGLQLVEMLAVQLKAEIEVHSGPGTEFVVTFRDEKARTPQRESEPARAV